MNDPVLGDFTSAFGYRYASKARLQFAALEFSICDALQEQWGMDIGIIFGLFCFDFLM